MRQAAKVLQAGGVVAYPTESFYALGADATDAEAVRRMFRTKQRGRGNPVAVICGSWQQVEKFFRLTEAERSLAQRYWPGPLTLLLKPKKAVAARTLAPTTPGPSSTSPRAPSLMKEGVGGGCIGVRIPGHALARRLAAAAGVPLTATSANLAGQPPTKSPRAVAIKFPRLPVVRGQCGLRRRPSTIVAVEHGQLRVLRAGSVKPVNS